jgi:hypothetical protein
VKSADLPGLSRVVTTLRAFVAEGRTSKIFGRTLGFH